MIWLPVSNGASERAGEPGGELRGLALVLALREHGELVAADARERLGDVEHLVQTRGDLDQDVVARRRARACR